ncbi:MAG: hypothetical protein J4203_04610 [Candidatus Diapherotrites archaeon]|uniref:50S ribosomal protein L32e n=1 Tax=Candidatus Iainarchaeum sp. TaxID=3101447 RepID=A0A8T4LET3_9ARCH|nr:hypothetical protein [Candidatus Diapherotrites archaeon]
MAKATKDKGKAHGKKPMAATHATAKPKADKKPREAGKRRQKRAEHRHKKVKLKLSKELRKLQAVLAHLRRHPTFRGRFGEKYKRRISLEKWAKWRKPRGMDTLFKRDDGAWVKIGYRTPKAFRNLHPQGLLEALVANPAQLAGVKDRVIRIDGNVGRKKRIAIREKALELGLRVVN